MTSEPILRAQGRNLTRADVLQVQDTIDLHPLWSRHRVAQELCLTWDWRTPSGLLKSFAARSLLLKLEQRHGLRLPAVRTENRRRPWGFKPSAVVEPPPAECREELLPSLQPLQWDLCRRGTASWDQALGLLRQHHYLGCTRPVGTHLLYLVGDARDRALAVHLVSAAAWQCAARDRFIGWSAAGRATQLARIANHSRFLILPWVRVPHLASHLLGQLTRRISADWQQRHGWALELLETFVEEDRFVGTSYRAANWRKVGLTTGRTRQEKHHRARAPRKSVWVYPLHRFFRARLGVLWTGEVR